MNQSTKILLQLAALLAVAGTIGGYAYWGVFKPEQEKERRVDHELRLFAPQKLDEKNADGGSPPADFTHLVVTFNGETTELERTPGKPWFIVKPLKARADALIVDGLVSQLQSAKFKETLDENPDQAALAKYGLDQPRFVVEATATVNGETRAVTIYGGVENTFDGSVFVRRNDEKPVFTAPGGVRYSLAKSTYDLRDKTPFNVEEAKIDRLAVKSPINSYELQRDGKQWNLVKPSAEPADTGNVASMLAQMAKERAERFLDDTPANRTACGLDAPLLEATYTLTDGASVRLTVGRVHTDAGDAFCARREDADATVLAAVTTGATSFDRNPDGLRDQTVLRFKRELVTRMVFHNADGTEVIIERDAVDASAESWRITAPRPARARVFKVTGALWTLGNFKALAQGETKPKDWGKYGIDARAKYAALYGADGKELARLTIGKLVDGTPSAYYVRGSRDQVLQSDGSRFGELPFDLSVVIDEPDAGVTSP